MCVLMQRCMGECMWVYLSGGGRVGVRFGEEVGAC